MDTDFDDTDYATEAPLPTPRGTPYERSPMISRHPSRGPSPAATPYPHSSSPTPGHGKISPPLLRRTSNSHHLHDGAFDETISILDPRRFTPTLHANLVAEILSLRRELESKNNLVETLENELDETRADHETATASVATALKEAREVKRQLARAEKDDTMAVVAKERDEAVEALADMKKQMERLAKSRRAAEEDLEQLRKAHERDQEKFEEAKRGFERRAHVAEGRLKAVLDELSDRANAMSPPPTMAHHPQHQRVMSEDYGDFQNNDTASIRSMSISGRPTSLTIGDDEAERLGISLHDTHGNGLSLADELNFDESEEEGAGTENEQDPQTDAEVDNGPGDMVSDTGSVQDVDELPELAEIGIQVEPEIDYEERIQELEDLLDEKTSELERTYDALDKKTTEMEVLYGEIDEVRNNSFDLQEKLDFMSSAGLASEQEQEKIIGELETQLKSMEAREKGAEEEFVTRSLELETRSSELDERSSRLDEQSSKLEEQSTKLEERSLELDMRASKLEEQSSELEDLSSELEMRSSALEARASRLVLLDLELERKAEDIDDVKKMNEERSLILDDREIELEERERVLSAEEGEIKELKDWVDRELRILREGKEEVNITPAKVEIAPTTADASTDPLPLDYVSSESQTTEPRPKYVSAESQTSRITEPRPKYVSSESQTATEPRPKYVSSESQTTEPRSKYVSSESQTSPEPRPVYASSESQTESPEPQPLVEYVSSESQTMELPARPKTPVLETPKAQMQSSGIQTDPLKPVKPTFIRVPAIMVSPPEPTPPLPKPVMRSAAAQTRPVRTRTRSMQTEEIRLDERLKKFAPHLLPSALLPKLQTTVVAAEPQHESPSAPPRRSSKRTVRRSITAPVPAPSEPSPVTKSTTTSDMGVGTAFYSPKTDDDVEIPRTRSQRAHVTKNLFNNIDLDPDNVSSGDEFPEEGDSGSEYKTALSAPKPRKPQRNTPTLKLALGFPLVPEGELPKRQPSIRRNAMVSSGVHAHARARSPSLTSNRTSESGGTGGTSSKIGPPFPVPTRHSSKRPGYLSDRDRASPSPTSTRLVRNISSRPRPPRPQSIRKVRSAAALPSTRDGDQTRSPPPLSVSSNAPDSPGLPPPLPVDEISSPAFDRGRFGEPRHKHQVSNNTSTTGNTGQASVGSVQQTSVVDAIAQTMVGEWMWKYVRRRKSFGVSEPPQGDDIAGGQRHKRWVWLAPYERAVMWSSRQPTSGSALLGKSGRKRKRSILRPFGGPEMLSDVMERVLTKKVLIQSVLDVKDDTPLPKGATQPVFNRSILILTPARALKFTAPSRERHYVWLTALSFLSHSAESNDGLLALPPPMPFEYDQVERRQNLRPQPPPVPPAAPARMGGAFSATRDSVRLAKGKARASPAANHGYTSTNGSAMLNPRAMESTETLSAEPPSIPRFPGASRRRSNTNINRPQTRGGYEKSLQSYSTSNAGSIRDSFYGVGGIGIAGIGVGGIGLPSTNASFAHHGGYVMPRGGGGGTGLGGGGRGGDGGGGGGGGWDPGPVGTMRMEAFIDRRSSYDYDMDDTSSMPSTYHIRRDRRLSRHEDFWGGGGGGAGFYGDDDDFWRGNDPFRGF